MGGCSCSLGLAAEYGALGPLRQLRECESARMITEFPQQLLGCVAGSGCGGRGCRFGLRRGKRERRGRRGCGVGAGKARRMRRRRRGRRADGIGDLGCGKGKVRRGRGGRGGRRADGAGGAGGWRVALRGRHAPGRFVRCRSMMSWMSRADGCRERVNRRQAEASRCAICRVRVLSIGVERIKIPTVGMYARIAPMNVRALGWLARFAKVCQAECFT